MANIHVGIFMTFNPSTNLKQVYELENSTPKTILRLTEVFAMNHNIFLGEHFAKFDSMVPKGDVSSADVRSLPRISKTLAEK